MPENKFKLASLIKRGFTQHQELNPKLFNEKQELHKDVRDKLLLIANDFIDSLHIDNIDFEDIVLVGSIVNYNWNPYSDIDLHVIYDYSEIDGDPDLVSEFFLAKKSEWNQEHNVTIYEYDVELYGQDINDENISGGKYSILQNEWITKPKPESYEISESSLISKTKHFMRLIDDILSLDTSDETKVNKLKGIKDKIKKYRKSGLEEGGEYSEENMVFKMLRRTGYMDKLSDSKHEIEDKIMSLPEGLNLPKRATPEQWFSNLLNQTEQVTKPEYPDSIFFRINGEIYMEYNQKTKILYYHYHTIYKALESKFHLNYNQISELVKGMVEEHTNLKVNTTLCSTLIDWIRWKNIQI